MLFHSTVFSIISSLKAIWPFISKNLIIPCKDSKTSERIIVQLLSFLYKRILRIIFIMQKVINLIINDICLVKTYWWDFSGGPVAKTLHSQCQGPVFDPWSGNQIPQAATRISHTVSKNPKFYSKDPVCFK